MSSPHSKIRLAINGALGRMGRRVVALSSDAHTPFEIVAALEHPNHQDLGKTLAECGVLGPAAPNAASKLVGHFAPQAGPQVCIDFSHPDGTTTIASECAKFGVALISGTTGLTAVAESALAHAAKVVPVLHATNFSVGVALMAELTRRAAEVLGPDFAAEIVELHHSKKVDAPSGTAITLAESVATASGWNLADVARHGREGRVGSREREEIGIHAVRGGDVVGEHTVYFLGPEERVELTHRAGSRDIFVRGALRAAKWIVNRPPGRYAIKDLLL